MKRIVYREPCSKHTLRPLDTDCINCKKIVCSSCFVEYHELHHCKDDETVEAFRHKIKEKSKKLSALEEAMLYKKKDTGKRKAELLRRITEKEQKICKRNQELKQIIDRHTKLLLDELSVLKTRHLEEMELEMEEIDSRLTKLRSFEAYCNDVRWNGSECDICGSVEKLIATADALEKDQEAFIDQPQQSVSISFEITDLKEILQKSNNNLVGQIKGTTERFETYAVVVGLNDAMTITSDVTKINLHRPNEISTEIEIPTKMATEAIAAVNSNTMYVAGTGMTADEIWKYGMTSGWKKCASLVQGRRRHSAAFIDEVLYICGGISDIEGSVLDSVEAYNTVTNVCSTVGKLVHSVQSSGNCVPYKSSLHIFGGTDENGKSVSHVQVYNTIGKTCSLLSTQMPRPSRLMGAVLCGTSVVLLGCDSCFIYDFETETWREGNQFKTGVVHFGLVLENERLFVIGGGECEKDRDGIVIWKCRDDIRSIPLRNIITNKPIEWKIHGKLPRPCLVQAYAKLRFPHCKDNNVPASVVHKIVLRRIGLCTE